MMRNVRQNLITIRDNTDYHGIIKKRGIRNVTMNGTAILADPGLLIDDPALEEEVTVWRPSSKLWRISKQYYGSGRFYWIIGLYNDKPTDAHWEVGDPVYIPMPLPIVRQLLEY